MTGSYATDNLQAIITKLLLIQAETHDPAGARHHALPPPVAAAVPTDLCNNAVHDLHSAHVSV